MPKTLTNSKSTKSRTTSRAVAASPNRPRVNWPSLVVLGVIAVAIGAVLLVNALRGPQQLGAHGTADAFMTAMVSCDAASIHKYAPVRFASNSSELQSYRQECAKNHETGSYRLLKDFHDLSSKTVNGKHEQAANYEYEVALDKQLADIMLQVFKPSDTAPWQVAQFTATPVNNQQTQAN